MNPEIFNVPPISDADRATLWANPGKRLDEGGLLHDLLGMEARLAAAERDADEIEKELHAARNERDSAYDESMALAAERDRLRAALVDIAKGEERDGVVPSLVQQVLAARDLARAALGDASI